MKRPQPAPAAAQPASMPSPTPAARAATAALADALATIVREAVFDAFAELMDSQPKAPPARYLTRPDAAALFGVCAATIAEWERTKGLPSVRIGDTVRYSIEALDRWADERSRIAK